MLTRRLREGQPLYKFNSPKIKFEATTSFLLYFGVAHYDIVWWKSLIALKDFDTDRKSTRLNSSHTVISYAVFCLKKKKQT